MQKSMIYALKYSPIRTYRPEDPVQFMHRVGGMRIINVMLPIWAWYDL